MNTKTARFSDPVPSMPAARKALIDHVVRDAIDAFEDARRRHSEYGDAIDLDGELEAFEFLREERLRDARDHLVRVLLARMEPGDYGKAKTLEFRVHKTTGVVAGSRFYLASVIHEYSDCPVGDDPAHCGEPIMKLVHGDLADLAAAEVTDPGAVEVLDRDEPASVTDPELIRTAGEECRGAARRRPGDHGGGRPLPLLRQVMTLCGPWDPSPATVEVIALADGVHLDDVTATEEDLPELSAAGWHCLAGTPISLYARFIV